MWLWMIACGAPPVETPLAPTPEHCLIVTPGKIQFGEIVVGGSLSAPVILENRCTDDPGDGSETLDLTVFGVRVEDPSAPFAVEPANSPLIPTLSSTDLPVTFTPTTAGKWIATLLIGSDDADTPEAEVKLVGTGLGPVLSAPAPGPFDARVGCAHTQSVTITNIGNGDLRVEGLEIAGSTAFTVADAAFVLPPAASREVPVTYTPPEAGGDAATLRIVGPDGALAEVALEGSAVDDRIWREDTFALDPAELDVVFLVDDSATATAFRSAMGKEVSAFGAGIDGADFRIVALSGADAVLFGDVPITDVGDIGSLRTWLTAGMADRGASLTQAAHLATASGGDLAAGFHRAGALWSLVAVSDVDDDGGMLTITDEVDDFIALKGDPALFRYHAIAGDVPSPPCDAEAGVGYADAAALSGGWFGSICTTDWSATLAALATAVVGPGPTWTLAGPPIVSAVEVDGAPTSDWAVDGAELHLTRRPPGRAEVTARYVVAPTCP